MSRRKKDDKTVRICQVCGKEITAPKKWAYCSDECLKIGNRLKNNKKRQVKQVRPGKKQKPKKERQLNADLKLMYRCNLQYGQLQILRRQGMTDENILKQYGKQRKRG